MHGYACHTACRWFIWELPITKRWSSQWLNRHVVAGVTLSGSCANQNGERQRRNLNDVTMVAVTEDAIQLAGLTLVYAVSTGWSKDERIETNIATRLWCRACHANTLNPLVWSPVPDWFDHAKLPDLPMPLNVGSRCSSTSDCSSIITDLSMGKSRTNRWKRILYIVVMWKKRTRKIDNELRKLSLMKRQWICHKKHKTLAIAWKLFMRDIGSLWICAIYRTQKVSFFYSDWTPRNKSTKCAINSILDNVFLVEPHAKYFPAFYELHLFCSLTTTRLIVDLPPLIRKFVRVLI